MPTATIGKAARMIAAARAMQRETQQQLANRLTAISGREWTRDIIAAMENGRRKVEADDIPFLAAAQRVNRDWYFESPGGDPADDYDREPMRPYLIAA